MVDLLKRRNLSAFSFSPAVRLRLMASHKWSVPLSAIPVSSDPVTHKMKASGSKLASSGLLAGTARFVAFVLNPGIAALPLLVLRCPCPGPHLSPLPVRAAVPWGPPRSLPGLVAVFSSDAPSLLTGL